MSQRRRPPNSDTGAAAPRLTSRALLLALVLLVLVISYASSLRAWLDQRQQIAEATQQITAVKQQVAGLELERRRWADDAYIEQQARARLGFVMPGETGYRVIMPDGSAIGAEASPDPADQAQTRQWYETLWGSVQRAGRGP